MTPFQLGVLLHCHTSPNVPHPRKDEPEVKKILEAFVKEQFIEKDLNNNDCYKTIERGQVHINKLCETCWPIPTHGSKGIVTWVSLD